MKPSLSDERVRSHQASLECESTSLCVAAFMTDALSTHRRNGECPGCVRVNGATAIVGSQFRIRS